MLLLGCGAGKEETAAEELLQPYRDMSFCAMEAEVRCDGGDGTVWDFSLRCEYDPEGTTTVEVLSPETAAGVVAEIEGEDLTLRYRDLCLGAGTVSPEKLSPMQCLPELMAALRKGWLLAESREEVEGEPASAWTGRGRRAERSYPPSASGRGTAPRSAVRSPWRGRS